MLLEEKLTTRVSLETARRVRVLARALGISPSAYIRRVLEAELKHLEEANKPQKTLDFVKSP